MKPKNQRLVLVVAALVALLVAVLLAMWGLRDQASYFYTPADIAAGKAHDGEAIAARRNGRARIDPAPARRSHDPLRRHRRQGADTPVMFRGIAPDLFREG